MTSRNIIETLLNDKMNIYPLDDMEDDDKFTVEEKEENSISIFDENFIDHLSQTKSEID